RSICIRISRERRIAFCISAFFVGVAGCVFAQVQGEIQPDAFFLWPTFLAVAMLVVGGMKSLTGAVVGVVLLSVISEGLFQLENLGRALTGLPEVGLAVIMLTILLVRPGGITGGRELFSRHPSGSAPGWGGVVDSKLISPYPAVSSVR